MICRTGQICIVQSPTMNFIFFTVSNLNYTVFVSLAHMIIIKLHQMLIENDLQLDIDAQLDLESEIRNPK